MKLISIPSAEVIFPYQDWNCLRLSIKENFFYWGTEIKTDSGKKLYAWSFDGGKPPAINGDLNVLMLDSECSELDAYFNWIKTAFTVSAPHETEWVSVLKTLHSRFNYSLSTTPLNDALKIALKASGFEPHLGILAQREKFHFLSFEEIAFLYEKKWDPNTFELLETLDPEVRIALLVTLRKLSFTAQNTKDLIHHLLIVSRKIGVKAALTLIKHEVSHAEELRLSLFKIAQPELYQMSQSRIDKLRALKAPPRTAIYGDPSFETDIVKITHNPKTISDFEGFKSWIDSPDIVEKFRALFDVYKQ